MNKYNGGEDRTLDQIIDAWKDSVEHWNSVDNPRCLHKLILHINEDSFYIRADGTDLNYRITFEQALQFEKNMNYHSIPVELELIPLAYNEWQMKKILEEKLKRKILYNEEAEYHTLFEDIFGVPYKKEEYSFPDQYVNEYEFNPTEIAKARMKYLGE